MSDSDDDTFEAQRERVDRPIARLFGTYGRRHWAALTAGLVASLGAHLLGLVPPVVLGAALDAVFRAGAESTPYRLPLVPQRFIPPTAGGQFWFSVALIAAAFAVAAVSTWVKGWGLNTFAQSIQHEVRTDTYDAMQRLNMAFFADKQTGELMSILNNDVNRLEQFLNGGINVFTRLTITVGGIAVVLFLLNWQLALVTLVTVPVIGYFTYVFSSASSPSTRTCARPSAS